MNTNGWMNGGKEWKIKELETMKDFVFYWFDFFSLFFLFNFKNVYAMWCDLLDAMWCDDMIWDYVNVSTEHGYNAMYINVM